MYLQPIKLHWLADTLDCLLLLLRGFTSSLPQALTRATGGDGGEALEVGGSPFRRLLLRIGAKTKLEKRDSPRRQQQKIHIRRPLLQAEHWTL